MSVKKQKTSLLSCTKRGITRKFLDGMSAITRVNMVLPKDPEDGAIYLCTSCASHNFIQENTL